MKFRELIRPGYRIRNMADSQGVNAFLLILGMESDICDAAMSYILFSQSRCEVAEDPYAKERENIRKKITAENATEIVFGSIEDHIEENLKNEIAVLDEVMKQRLVPGVLVGRSVHIFAHSFLYALDGFEKKLVELKLDCPNKERLDEAQRIFSEASPHCEKVRNSAHHREDRLQGFLSKKMKNRRESFNQALYIGNLIDDSIEYTIEDGSRKLVLISDSVVNAMIDSMLMVYSAYTWSGPRELVIR